MNEFYFILSYNDETKEWTHEVDVEYVKFGANSCLNIDEDRWLPYINEDGSYKKGQTDGEELLDEAISILNRLSAVFHLRNRKEI